MNQKILNKAIETSFNLKHLTPGRSKHFSFLIRKNKIVSIGWNNGSKSHPIAAKFNYQSQAIHSELHCILNADKIDKKCYMINIRIGQKDEILMSCPCQFCQTLLLHYNIRDVLYSTKEGFSCLKMNTTQ